MDLAEAPSATMATEEGTGAAAAAMTDDTPGMMEVATSKVAEATAAVASITTIATGVAAKGTDVRTQLAGAKSIESPRTVLRHHLPVRAEAVAVAGGQGLTPPMAERSETLGPG